MRTTRTRYLPLIAAATLAAGMIPAILHADTPFRESHDADPQGMVEIIGITDSVDVTGWDQPRVEVTGARRIWATDCASRPARQRTVIDCGAGRRQASGFGPRALGKHAHGHAGERQHQRPWRRRRCDPALRGRQHQRRGRRQSARQQRHRDHPHEPRPAPSRSR